ncbi:DUF4209 domain-containing protein [Amycolatopsis melonis]|uniref:DUF4209 domain-containing protein n=1 Tax=Amycolatopsis melonis TaxID=3156488 RepID=UPI003D6CFE95
MDESWGRYLSTLLAGPTGWNLRNELAHGFVDEVSAPMAALLIQAALYVANLAPRADEPPPTPEAEWAHRSRRTCRPAATCAPSRAPGSRPQLAAAEAWEAAGQPDTESTAASGAEFAPSYGLRSASANRSSMSSYLPRTMSSCCRSSGRTGPPPAGHGQLLSTPFCVRRVAERRTDPSCLAAVRHARVAEWHAVVCWCTQPGSVVPILGRSSRH